MKQSLEIYETFGNYTSDQLADVVRDVIHELGSSEKIHSAHTWTPHEGYEILQEEVDELFDAIEANELRHAKEEAVQVACVAIAFILKAEWWN